MATEEEKNKALAALDKLYEAMNIIATMESYKRSGKGGDIWIKLDNLIDQLLEVFDKPGS